MTRSAAVSAPADPHPPRHTTPPVPTRLPFTASVHERGTHGSSDGSVWRDMARRSQSPSGTPHATQGPWPTGCAAHQCSNAHTRFALVLVTRWLPEVPTRTLNLCDEQHTAAGASTLELRNHINFSTGAAGACGAGTGCRHEWHSCRCRGWAVRTSQYSTFDD